MVDVASCSHQPTPDKQRALRQPTRIGCRWPRSWVAQEGVKVLLAAFPLVLLGSVATIPLLLAGGDPPPLVACAPNVASLDQVLATIRALESGGDYRAQAQGSTASGAYQFIDGTWDDYAGYPTAASAPPDIQDAKAAEMVGAILDEHGSVEAVPVIWYLGHLPAPDSTTWDRVPAPDAGNTLTPRQYQRRWLAKFEELGSADSATTRLTTEAEPQSANESSDDTPACIGGPNGETLPGGWALPGPRSLLVETIGQIDDPHHTYPAWDWIIPTGVPIYAVRGGTVTNVSAWPHNWWEQGCTERGRNGCAACGIGVTVVDDTDGTRWTYCHGSDLHVTHGSRVDAGALLITSGNTGRSGTPHLHLEIRTTGGIRRCPQDLLAALLEDGAGTDPAKLPSTGCSL